MARHQCFYNNQKYIILPRTQKLNRDLQGIKKLHVEQTNSKGNKVTEFLKGDENEIREKSSSVENHRQIWKRFNAKIG